MPLPLQQPNPADPAFSQKRELLLSAAGSQADVPALKSLTIQHDGSLDPNAEHWVAIMLATPEELNEIFTQTAMQSATGADIAPLLRLPSSLARKTSAEVRNVVARRMKQHCSTFEVSGRHNDGGMNPMLIFVCTGMCHIGRRRVSSHQRTENGAVVTIMPASSNGRKTNADAGSSQIFHPHKIN